MARFMVVTIDIAADLFLVSGKWSTVREVSAHNADAIASERRRYQAFASGAL